MALGRTVLFQQRTVRRHAFSLVERTRNLQRHNDSRWKNRQLIAMHAVQSQCADTGRPVLGWPASLGCKAVEAAIRRCRWGTRGVLTSPGPSVPARPTVSMTRPERRAPTEPDAPLSTVAMRCVMDGPRFQICSRQLSIDRTITYSSPLLKRVKGVNLCPIV
jgi:hypothetical protein